jgi:flagellin-like hook-associated protein FlgL
VDPDAIKNAEMRIADVQSALDDAQQVLQAAERAQQTAEKSAEVMRTVALAALGGLILLSLVHAVRRHH